MIELAREKVAQGVPVQRSRSEWPGWGGQRHDSRDYARLRAELRPRLRPVSVVERKALHVKGQIPLWGGK
jgi:hypothetical protein